MVRDEADLIESFVRYHCEMVDHMLVVDHLSSDATPQILDALVAEGLPLTRVRENRADMAQAEVTSHWMRRTARDQDADWVLPLDADEFLAAEGDKDPRDLLHGLSPDGAFRIPWRTYVPRPEDPDEDSLLLRIRHRRVVEPKPYYKMLVPGVLARREEVALQIGNHRLLDRSGRRPRKVESRVADGLFLAHFPVRSPAQLLRKALLWPAWLANPDMPAKAVPHYRDLFARFKSGGEPSPRELMALALSYPIHDFAEGEEPELELAPIRPRGGPLALRYPVGELVDTVSLLADCAERLARELADARRAASRPGWRRLLSWGRARP